MEFEDKLDYLTEHTQGMINNLLREFIKEYYSLKNDYEDVNEKYEELKENYEELKENYENYKEHSRPLTAYEESGMRDADFY